jgi:hypothetical protein
MRANYERMSTLQAEIAERDGRITEFEASRVPPLRVIGGNGGEFDRTEIRPLPSDAAGSFTSRGFAVPPVCLTKVFRVENHSPEEALRCRVKITNTEPVYPYFTNTMFKWLEKEEAELDLPPNGHDYVVLSRLYRSGGAELRLGPVTQWPDDTVTITVTAWAAASAATIERFRIEKAADKDYPRVTSIT